MVKPKVGIRPKRKCNCIEVARKNEYFSFLRHFATINRNKYSAQNMIRYADIEWNKLPRTMKQGYKKLAALQKKQLELKEALEAMTANANNAKNYRTKGASKKCKH